MMSMCEPLSLSRENRCRKKRSTLLTSSRSRTLERSQPEQWPLPMPGPCCTVTIENVQMDQGVDVVELSTSRYPSALRRRSGVEKRVWSVRHVYCSGSRIKASSSARRTSCCSAPFAHGTHPSTPRTHSISHHGHTKIRRVERTLSDLRFYRFIYYQV